MAVDDETGNGSKSVLQIKPALGDIDFLPIPVCCTKRDTEFIQESLGHADKRTTENYLDGFDNDIKKANAAKLFEFKKI